MPAVETSRERPGSRSLFLSREKKITKKGDPEQQQQPLRANIGVYITCGNRLKCQSGLLASGIKGANLQVTGEWLDNV
jgi:hypothetical protein